MRALCSAPPTSPSSGSSSSPQAFRGFHNTYALGEDPAKDSILEVAVLATDGNLVRQIPGPTLVLGLSLDAEKALSPELSHRLSENGLLDLAKKSQLTPTDAEKQVAEFLRQTVPERTTPLAGYSCYHERSFLLKRMPAVNEYLDYHNLDVSVIGMCCSRWGKTGAYTEGETRLRAAEDLQGHVNELARAKKTVFGL